MYRVKKEKRKKKKATFNIQESACALSCWSLEFLKYLIGTVELYMKTECIRAHAGLSGLVGCRYSGVFG